MAVTPHTNNYVLGRGRLYFGRFAANTFVHSGLVYFGNTPAVNVTVEEETLEHFNSDAGIKKKDLVVTLSQEINGSFQTDNISAESLAKFFAAESSTVTQTSVAAAVTTLTDIILGAHYQLGVTDARPQGYRPITSITSAVQGSDTLVSNTDYALDTITGLLQISAGSTVVAAGDDVVVTYAVPSATYQQIADADESVYGRMLYVSDNPVGDEADYLWPYVKLTADGDFALKGDELQIMSFNFEALELNDSTPRQIILPR